MGRSGSERVVRAKPEQDGEEVHMRSELKCRGQSPEATLGQARMGEDAKRKPREVPDYKWLPQEVPRQPGRVYRTPRPPAPASYAPSARVDVAAPEHLKGLPRPPLPGGTWRERQL